MASQTLWQRDLGHHDYLPVWRAMQDYTASRTADSPDEIWFVEHDPVFTQGQAGKAEHLLMPGDIPVVQVDRGGQVTYHGPGQLVAYVLLDLKRLGIGVRDLVTGIEQSLVAVLAQLGIAAHPRADAPGVYVQSGAKIAQLGLRVKRGCSFHGLSLNVDMDLSVFQRINPCGYQGLAVTDIQHEGGASVPAQAELATALIQALSKQFGYSQYSVREQHGLPRIEEIA